MPKVSLNVNGKVHHLDVDEKTPLIYVLRNDLGLKGTKLGCGLEQCGLPFSQYPRKVSRQQFHQHVDQEQF